MYVIGQIYIDLANTTSWSTTTYNSGSSLAVFSSCLNILQMCESQLHTPNSMAYCYDQYRWRESESALIKTCDAPITLPLHRPIS